MAPQPKEWPRQSFQEAFELTRLPDQVKENGEIIQKFMSRQPAWVPGNELPWHLVGLENDKPLRWAFGGIVYAMAPLAASRVVEEEEERNDGIKGVAPKSGIHSLQAVFTNPGRTDRPFVFDVSTVHSSRSFSTRLINARQLTNPSSVPQGPFPLSDAESSLGSTCLTCIATFKRQTPSPADIQEPLSPQDRYRDILNTRKPEEWEASPQADIDRLNDMFPNAGHGGFPVLDMYKVDMRAFNADRPLPEKRELILYRLMKPLPVEDVNAHILCHAFGADRNGLIMLGNHLGYGYDLGPVASLSYSFYVHVNAEEAVLRGDGFWIQEVSWPRVSAGRGMMESRIWSPEGKHVATGYQDGIIMPGKELSATLAEKGKL